MQARTLKRIQFQHSWGLNTQRNEHSSMKKSSKKMINIFSSPSGCRSTTRGSTRTESIAALTRTSTRPSTAVYSQRNKGRKLHKRSESDCTNQKRNFVVNSDLLLQFQDQKYYQQKLQKYEETYRFSQFLEQSPQPQSPNPQQSPLSSPYLNPHPYTHPPKRAETVPKRFFKEDMLKLHNLLTGGYTSDDQFLSLTQFNYSKERFSTLKNLYQNAEKEVNRNSLAKCSKKRDIFSVVFLNRNIKNLGQKQSNQILTSLKMAR